MKDFEKCIIELQKPEKERDLPTILKYIQTLKGFVNILKLTNDDFNFNLTECAKILNYSRREENEIIVEEGEKGDSFFLLLKGSVSFLISKQKKYEMTKEEYLFHLFKLRKNNANELLRQCLQLNALVFPIEDSSFDNFLKNLVKKKTKNEELLDNKIIYSAAKNLYKYIKTHDYSKDKKITIENYINRNNVNLENEEDYFSYENKEKKRVKKTVTIPNFIVIGKSGKGETFGELALEENGGKRKATVITNEITHFAIIYRNQYNTLLKNAIEKVKKKFFTVINYYNIFSSISPLSLEKKYYKLFTMIKIEKGKNLIYQNEENDKVYFIINGDFEISTFRNIFEINELIIYYKKFIRKYSSKTDFKFYNPNNEIRENEDLTLNKKFKTEEQNKILFERRIIKLNIFQNKDILGLSDLMLPITTYIYKGLINCKCVGQDNQIYSLQRNNFFFIMEHEEDIKDKTIEYEINKMKILIQRLEMHKDKIYNLIKKKDDELQKISQEMNLNNLINHRKNRFTNIDKNVIVENQEIKNIMEKVEKDKENKRKLWESERKKINKFDIFKNKRLILPKIKVNNTIQRENSGNLSNRLITSNSELYVEKYKEKLIQKNLYEGVFNSYAFTERNENEKNNFNNNKLLSPIVNKRNKIYDALILDRFNSCYTTALRKIKYS